VLVASTGEEQPPRQVLSAVYQRLGKVLAREGLTPLEKDGPYDESCQEVVATQATDEADRHHVVAETVRPGYLLNGGVLRPQQVVVYVFEGAPAPA
jgi:molecular chaperone GrpE